ncbi:hypothetical protein LO763_22745 [Glycomyces sp. A-F 0318]|uniref:hypothetical protein n=1 Tax=Glycomyces amatae TaxID=2881355 RepID=UPI001E63DEAC|nr:hypothetical protein [Glycomyces amatae]MCD0446438.1 hypothetical protein [Glycomyces amatae]
MRDENGKAGADLVAAGRERRQVGWDLLAWLFRQVERIVPCRSFVLSGLDEGVDEHRHDGQSQVPVERSPASDLVGIHAGQLLGIAVNLLDRLTATDDPQKH